MFTRVPLILLPPALCVLLAAAPPGADSPDDLIRRANAAFLAGDAPAADALYVAAEERTADPGLVAFNRAAVLFKKGDFHAAEVHYSRTLDDRACPPDRAARAWFNRGTCLLRRGGDAAVFRSAIGCFERCLGSPAADDPLKADARHNLELAKQLWAEANRKAAKPESPSLPPETEQPEPMPPQGVTPEQSPDGPNDGGKGGRDPRQPPTGPPGAVAQSGPAQDAGTPTPGTNTSLPALDDTERLQPLSPEDTRAYLRNADARIRKERQSMLRLLYAPDRPGVRDW